MLSIQNTSVCHTAERAVWRAQCACGTRSTAILYYISCKNCDLLCII